MASGIQSIELINFQSHVKTKLDFSPGVNVIKGPNDTGKSAILRALESVVFFSEMKPRRGAKFTKVTVHFFDGGYVSRERKVNKSGEYIAGSQIYEFNGEQHQSLKNSKLPDEIEEYLNMAQVLFPEEKVKFPLNIAKQIPERGPFLIGSGYSGQTRVRILGGMTGHHHFDELAKKSKKLGSSFSKEAKTIEKMLKEEKEKLQEIEKETNYQSLYERIDRKRKKLVDMENKRKDLEAIFSLIKEGVERLNEIANQRTQIPNVEVCRRNYSKFRSHRETRGEYSRSFSTLRESHRRLERIQRDMERLPDISRVALYFRSEEILKRRHLLHLLDHARSTSESLRQLEAKRSQRADVSALRRKIERLEDLSLRNQDWRKTYDLHQHSSRRLREIESERTRVKSDLIHRRSGLIDYLNNLSICPYAPKDSAIEFQTPCKDKLSV